MKLKGLSLGQICDSFAYHSIEKLMWCTKHLVSAVGTVMEKKVLFFHKPFQERKECTFMFLLEDISFHNVKKSICCKWMATVPCREFLQVHQSFAAAGFVQI